MPTKRELVGAAFAELGIGNWLFDIQPDEIQNAISRMDSMMAEWSKGGIRLGYNATSDDPDVETGLPDWAKRSVILNVAKEIAPGFGKQLSPLTLANAGSAYDSLQSNSQQIPQRRFPNTLPLGAGNRYYPGVNFFPTVGPTLDVGGDSELDLKP